MSIRIVHCIAIHMSKNIYCIYRIEYTYAGYCHAEKNIGEYNRYNKYKRIYNELYPYIFRK